MHNWQQPDPSLEATVRALAHVNYVTEAAPLTICTGAGCDIYYASDGTVLHYAAVTSSNQLIKGCIDPIPSTDPLSQIAERISTITGSYSPKLTPPEKTTRNLHLVKT